MTERRYKKGVAAPGDIPTDAARAFGDRLQHIGGHKVWQGTTDHGMTAVLDHRGVRYPALRVAWVLHYGTAPVGQVRSSCDQDLCVAGTHLTDAALRQRDHLLLAHLLGVDMSGTCDAGHIRSVHGTVRGNRKVDCRPCDAERRKAQRAQEKEMAA